MHAPVAESHRARAEAVPEIQEKSLSGHKGAWAESEPRIAELGDAHEDGLVFRSARGGSHAGPQRKNEKEACESDAKGKSSKKKKKKAPRQKEQALDGHTRGDHDAQRRVPENFVVLKNIPSRMVEVEVLMAISSMGFYDVLEDFNMPMRADKEGRPLNKGFAFVSFADRVTCEQFCQRACGFQFKDRLSQRALTACLAA